MGIGKRIFLLDAAFLLVRARQGRALHAFLAALATACMVLRNTRRSWSWMATRLSIVVINIIGAQSEGAPAEPRHELCATCILK